MGLPGRLDGAEGNTASPGIVSTTGGRQPSQVDSRTEARLRFSIQQAPRNGTPRAFGWRRGQHSQPWDREHNGWATTQPSGFPDGSSFAIFNSASPPEWDSQGVWMAQRATQPALGS